jgi:hypothetical protein
MTTTAIGLFDGFTEAQRLIPTLVAQGIQSEGITIIANRAETSVGEVLVAAAWGEPAALIALGVPADEAQPYALVLDGGGALVSVAAADDQVDQVVALMERYTTENFEVQAVLS